MLNVPTADPRPTRGAAGRLAGDSAVAIGATIPFGRFMPGGYVPVALAQDNKLHFPGKSPDLVVLGDKPLVAETPAHLLDDAVTPTDKHFIRNNGQIPDPPANADAWELVVDGEVNAPIKITLGELKQRFPQATYQLMLECGGNGRAQFVLARAATSGPRAAPAAPGGPASASKMCWSGGPEAVCQVHGALRR